MDHDERVPISLHFRVTNLLAVFISVTSYRDVLVCHSQLRRPFENALFCLADVNECDSTPCQNGGSCIDGIDSFTCKCQNGYTGINCQRRKLYSYRQSVGLTSVSYNTIQAYQGHDIKLNTPCRHLISHGNVISAFCGAPLQILL